MRFARMFEGVVSVYFEMMQNLLAQPSFGFSGEPAIEVPAASGVYHIQDKVKKQIIYAGRTKNLKRRLLGDHKRGNIEGSQFRKAFGQRLGTEVEKEISEYIKKNCSYQFLLVPSFPESVRPEHFEPLFWPPS